MASGGLASTCFDTLHQDLIHDAQFDFYGKRVATCSSDRVVKVFQVEVGERGEDKYVPVGEIALHDGPVWQVAWAHPQFGSLLATCGYDKRVMVFREAGAGSPGGWVRVFNYEDHFSSGACLGPTSQLPWGLCCPALCALPHHSAPAHPLPRQVNSIAWAPPELGLHLACASSDGTVSVLSHRAGDDGWDVHKLRDCPGGVMAVSWAPATPGGLPMLATAGCDGNVRVWLGSPAPGGAAGGGGGLAWEAAAAKTLALGGGGSAEWARDVAWCPVALPAAAPGASELLLAACADNGRVALWRCAERSAEQPALRWGSDAPVTLPLFNAPVWKLSWSPTGRLLAVSCGDNAVTLWKEDVAGTWMSVCNAPVAVDVQ